MCLFPQTAELQEFGKPKFTPEGSLQLPCGRCTECLSKRSIEWATRAKHEISMHDENCFITLTYNEDNLPSILLVKEDFQKFMKRLRRYTSKKIRYMVSGEYGSQSFRPHFHAIIFGYNFPDQKLLKYSKSGEPLFTSPLLEKLWDKGYSSIGTANEKTAYYIASYALKGKKHTFPNEQGEFITVNDYMDCSKRPAIGREYLERHKKQLVQSGSSLPRYYLKVLEKIDIDLLEEYQNQLQEKFSHRSSQEYYSKYILDQQKIAMSDGFLRSAPEKQPEDIFYKNHLKKERDIVAQRKQK